MPKGWNIHNAKKSNNIKQKQKNILESNTTFWCKTTVVIKVIITIRLCLTTHRHKGGNLWSTSYQNNVNYRLVNLYLVLVSYVNSYYIMRVLLWLSPATYMSQERDQVQWTTENKSVPNYFFIFWHFIQIQALYNIMKHLISVSYCCRVDSPCFCIFLCLTAPF